MEDAVALSDTRPPVLPDETGQEAMMMMAEETEGAVYIDLLRVLGKG